MNGVQSYTVGQTGTLWDPDNMVAIATITVTAPTFANTDADGDTPQYGYFATFTVTVTDIAPLSPAISVVPSDSDYYVSVNGSDYGYGTPNLGNTAKAERDDALGNGLPAKGLNPGQTTTGTVTIDVPSVHGSFVYGPDGTPLGSWSY